MKHNVDQNKDFAIILFNIFLLIINKQKTQKITYLTSLKP